MEMSGTGLGLAMARAPERVEVMHVTETCSGGVMVSLGQVLRGLDRRRFRLTLVYSLRPGDAPDLADNLPDDVRLIPLAMAGTIAPCADARAVRQLAKLMRQERPQVVHLHSSKAGALGRVAARLAGVPRVFYSPEGYSFLRTDVSRAQRWAYRVAEHLGSYAGGTVIACSQGEYELTQRLTSAVALVNNGIDLQVLDQIAPAEAAPRCPGLVRVIGCGRITEARAPQLFAAVARVLAPGGGSTWTWVGDGEAEGRRALQSSGVEISGWLPRSAAVNAIRDADIFLHTSRWEGMPLALLEAMALCKPVVATNVIGNRDAIRNGVEGYLGTSATELAGAVGRLAKDPNLRQIMGQRARTRVEQEFSLPGMVARLEQLYVGAASATQVLASRAAAGRV